jgi:amino acid permease
MKVIAIILGLLFLALAIAYFVIPAESLPSFLPGFEAGSARVHVKHGLASLVVAVVLFVIAWYAGRSSR